jgi:hypothetical protein
MEMREEEMEAEAAEKGVEKVKRMGRRGLARRMRLRVYLTHRDNRIKMKEVRMRELSRMLVDVEHTRREVHPHPDRTAGHEHGSGGELEEVMVLLERKG